MGYSKEYVENMTKLHQTLRKNPKSLVQIIEGPDHLCAMYPNSGVYHCKDHHIYVRDEVILEKLGLKLDETYEWKEIENRVRNFVIPSDIQTICETCNWRSYGVCEEGIQHIIDEKGLWKVN